MSALRKVWIPLGGMVFLALAVLATRSTVLYDGESDISGTIRVVERWNGLRELYLGEGRARQTALHLDRPGALEIAYTRVAMLGLGFLPENGRVLFVGLGGGSMPRFVEHHRPDAEIHAVELDPEVERVARDHFGFQGTVHVGDGRAFVEATEAGTWDVIVLDAFADNRVPRSLATREFLEAVRAALTPDGAVVSNLLTTDPDYRSMLVTYRTVFPGLATVGVPGRRQRIVLAGADTTGLRPGPLAVNGARVTEELALDFDLGAYVDRDFLDARDVEAPLLEDGTTAAAGSGS